MKILSNPQKFLARRRAKAKMSSRQDPDRPAQKLERVRADLLELSEQNWSERSCRRITCCESNAPGSRALLITTMSRGYCAAMSAARDGAEIARMADQGIEWRRERGADIRSSRPSSRRSSPSRASRRYWRASRCPRARWRSLRPSLGGSGTAVGGGYYEGTTHSTLDTKGTQPSSFG